MLEGEEKSSLNKIGSAAGSREAKRMKSYYFPEIPIERLLDGGLQPLGYDEHGVVFPILSGGTSEDGGLVGHQRQESDKAREDAYMSGFKEGEKAGIESGKNRLEPVLASFHKSLLELAKQKEKLLISAERQVIDLAMAVAERIIGHEIGTNHEAIISIVKEALKKIVDHESIKIRINPSDLQVVENARPQFSEFVDNLDKIIFEGDKTILNGGCVIETTLGEIDGRIEKQLEAIDEIFKSELEGSESGS